MGALGVSVSRSVFSVTPQEAGSTQTLSFYNTHTGELLTAAYRTGGRTLSQGLARINHILRDHRAGEVSPIDVKLLDLLCALSRKLDNAKPFHIISGYRSPQTNALLRRLSKGIAKNSLHLYGKAVDIRLPGCRLSHLRQAALELKAGGVGYYPSSNFIHVDVGRIRAW